MLRKLFEEGATKGVAGGKGKGRVAKPPPKVLVCSSYSKAY